MAQCIEAVSGLSPQRLQEMKSVFWNMTSLTDTVKTWFSQLSPAFFRHREQIRILSVYSCSTEVDKHVIEIAKKYLSRFRYVVVEPVNSRMFEKDLMALKQSSLHSIEISPYPHFLTYETLEQFDLILIFGVPLNRSAADIVIRKSKMLLRHGGQACIFDPADNDLGLLINLLYSAAEDCQPGTSSYTTIVNKRIVSPGKDEVESSSCSEEIALSEEEVEGEEDCDKPIGKSKPEPEEYCDVINVLYPTDPTYIRSLLDRLNFVYSRSTLGCEIDLKECFEKTEVGINALSGLMKIDLTGVMGPVVDRIIDFLTVRTMENTTIMTYNYHVYTIFSDVLGSYIQREPVTTPTPWFPEGEKGPFVNYGLEAWKKRINEWRTEGSEEPVEKEKIGSVDAIIEIIKNNSITQRQLPQPINLDDLLHLCSEVWKCDQHI